MGFMQIAIVGFAREGKSTLRFIKKQPAYRGAEIWVLDQNPRLKVPKGVRSILGKRYLDHLTEFDLVFRTPGVPWNHPKLRTARRRGVRFSSQMKLFLEHCRGTVIGVTGTKGKGTTSTLIYTILRAAGRKAFLAGNIGAPALDLLPAVDKNTFVVLELSSFQLQDLAQSPHAAVILDIFPDHQDAHKTLKEYYEAKTNIARHQKRGDLVFFFKRNVRSCWAAKKSGGRGIPVDETAWRLFRPADLKVRGSHNFKNAVMAASVALRLGVPKHIVLRAVKAFRGIEHRLELIRTAHGISFYNDSASTNPHTAAAAVRAFDGPNVLIAGGSDKGLDYRPLADALRGSATRLVVLFGENKRKIRTSLRRSGIPIAVFGNNLRTAVRAAYRGAQQSGSRTVVFSPGAASFDMFKNYADRGEQFKKIVKSL